MRIRLASAFALFSGVFALAACSSSTSYSGSLPPGLGLTCGSSTTAGNTAELTAKLASASSGTCVVLTDGVNAYAGPFDVPAGVSVVAQNGSRSLINGGTAQSPAITLREGGQLVNVDVKDTLGVAVAVRAANASVTQVNVSGAKNAALAVLCAEAATPGCAAGTITIKDTTLQTSTLGLWVSGAHVAMTGGNSSNHASTSLSSAAGIIAESGASLDLDTVTIEKNEGVGVLLDGAETKATIKDATINENSERGLWAQKLAGTIDAPALTVTNTNITKNKVVGVGGVQAKGIIIVGGSVVGTVAAPQVTTLSTTEMVGDGFGLFSTADVKFDGTDISQNDRAAGLVDQASADPTIVTGIIIVGGKPVSAGASGLKVVVQNAGAATVQIASTDESTPATKLGVSSPTLAVPGVL